MLAEAMCFSFQSADISYCVSLSVLKGRLPFKIRHFRSEIEFLLFIDISGYLKSFVVVLDTFFCRSFRI